MRNAAINAALIIAGTVLLFVTADESVDEADCDPGSGTVAYSETEYFVCHESPMAVGQGEQKGVWVRWICEYGTSFDAEVCRPAVDQEIHDPQSRELMDQMTFCRLLNGEDDPDDEYAPDYPTCNVYMAPLVFDGEDRHWYYQCYSKDTEKICGYWYLQGCEEEDEDEEEFFDNTKQKCIKLRKKKKSFLDSFLRQGYISYLPTIANPFVMPMGVGNPYGMGMGTYGASLGPPVFGGWPGAPMPGGPMPTDGGQNNYGYADNQGGGGEGGGEGDGGQMAMQPPAPIPPPGPMPPPGPIPPFAPPPFMQSGVPAPHRYRAGQLAPPLPFSMQDLNVYFMSMRPWNYPDAPTRPPPKAPPESAAGGGFGGFAKGALSLFGKAAKAAGPLAFLG